MESEIKFDSACNLFHCAEPLNYFASAAQGLSWFSKMLRTKLRQYRYLGQIGCKPLGLRDVNFALTLRCVWMDSSLSSTPV